jgi:hypothetical protein
MVSESLFDERVNELQEWIKNHDALPEIIGKCAL